MELQSNLLVVHSKQGEMSVKNNVHVRLKQLPPFPPFSRACINEITCSDYGKLIQFKGVVVRTKPTKMLEMSKQFECMSPKCLFRFTVHADLEQDYLLPTPTSCPSGKLKKRQENRVDSDTNNLTDSSSNGKSNICTCTKLREVEGMKSCVDFQEIVVQDTVQNRPGSVPRTITLYCTGNLVDSSSPGEEITVIGIIGRQWKPVYPNNRCSVKYVIHANNIYNTNGSYSNNNNGSNSDLIGVGNGNEFSEYWDYHNQHHLHWQGRDAIVKAVS